VRRRIGVFIAVIQSVLFLSHWFLYFTWTSFTRANPARGSAGLAVALGLLSITFVTASLLAFRYSNPLVRIYYTLSAVWAGWVSYFVLAASACWLVAGVARLGGLSFAPRRLAEGMFGLALLAGIYGVANANWIRIRRITVPIEGSPAGWHGRVAALVSDLHLGHVRNLRFAQRIARIIERLQPDAVFIAGDLYDGTAANIDRLAQPFGQIRAPLGTFFIAGNHEEFRGHARYLDAVRRGGVRVLDDEELVIDGLQIIGIHFRDSVDPERFRALLRCGQAGSAGPGLLLTHAPNHLKIAEEEGIALVLCGHTHRGQFFPFRWLPKRIYGRYVYGLERLGRMWVYTSSGVGTWGPPLRVGTTPEIVLIRFVDRETD
jgi:predicted MPP superfamily phosphohydrolase